MADTPMMMQQLQPVDDEGVIAAYLRIDLDGTVRFLWLPDIFRSLHGVRLDDKTRADMVDTLRRYADKLETKEMDALFEKTKMAYINTAADA
jgi:hypothetical protein